MSRSVDLFGSEPGVGGTEQEIIFQRILAFGIDSVITVTLGAVITALLAAFFDTSMSAFTALAVLVYFGYFIGFEAWTGQTPGKQAMGIIVVRPDGTTISPTQSAIRNLLRVVDGLGIYLVGLVVMLITRKRQRIGDIASDTVVLEARR